MPAKAKPAASAPKPKPSAAKPKAAAAGASHPTYFEMIKEAIVTLKDRTGSSTVAIAKHIKENHGASLPTNFKKILSVQLRASVSKGKLVKVKASYKLSDAAKKGSPKAARSSTSKKGSPKAARSSTAKKGSPNAARSSTAKKANKIVKDAVASIRNATGMSSAEILTYIEEKHGPALASVTKKAVAGPKRKAAEKKAVASPKRKAAEKKAGAKAKISPADKAK